MFSKVQSESYFRRVLGNLHACRDIGEPQGLLVRAGTLGNGTAPNYQIQNQDGTARRCFMGLTHKVADEEQFEDEHLTDAYSYSDIQGFIAKLR